MSDDFKPFSMEHESSDVEDDVEIEEEVSRQSVTMIDEPRQSVMIGDDLRQSEMADTGDTSSMFNVWWQNLRKVVLPTQQERTEQFARRISRLSSAIELYPDSPTNYVLRGELYLQKGEYLLAVEDFQRALELAVAQVESEDWGIVAQAIQDRAQDGLAEALRLTL